MSTPVDSSTSPLAGLYRPNALKGLYYGPSCVDRHLVSCLPTPSSKAFIITGTSLATKTPLVKQVESLLTTRHHAGTFAAIRQHAPVADLDRAQELVAADADIDTIISIGGGSPIDAAKAIAYRQHEKTSKWLMHIAIPTTLSAAECTVIAGYTQSSGVKTAVVAPELYPAYVFYDPAFGRETPAWLFMSTGMRSMDHALELQYYPTATEMPTRLLAIQAASLLFEYLPRYHADPTDDDVITRLFLAAYASFGFLGLNMKGSLGLSHTLGYALGSPYDIPHGITSCITLGKVVQLKCKTDPAAAANVARLLPLIGGTRSGDDVRDGCEVGRRVIALVQELGLNTTLTAKGVGRDQVSLIVERATGGMKESKTYEAVKGIVESFY